MKYLLFTFLFLMAFLINGNKGFALNSYEIRKICKNERITTTCIKNFWSSVIFIKSDLNLMIFQIGWAALAAIFTFSIAMVVWGRNGDGSIDIWLFLFKKWY